MWKTTIPIELPRALVHVFQTESFRERGEQVSGVITFLSRSGVVSGFTDP